MSETTSPDQLPTSALWSMAPVSASVLPSAINPDSAEWPIIHEERIAITNMFIRCLESTSNFFYPTSLVQLYNISSI